MNNEVINIRNRTKMRNQSMNDQFKSISENELNQISGCSGVKPNDTGECDENKNDEITDDQLSLIHILHYFCYMN